MPCALQIIKLSDAVQPLPRQATQFVHGAPGSFLAIGDLKALAPEGAIGFSTHGAPCNREMLAIAEVAADEGCVWRYERGWCCVPRRVAQSEYHWRSCFVATRRVRAAGGCMTALRVTSRDIVRLW